MQYLRKFEYENPELQNKSQKSYKTQMRNKKSSKKRDQNGQDIKLTEIKTQFQREYDQEQTNLQNEQRILKEWQFTKQEDDNMSSSSQKYNNVQIQNRRSFSQSQSPSPIKNFTQVRTKFMIPSQQQDSYNKVFLNQDSQSPQKISNSQELSHKNMKMTSLSKEIRNLENEMKGKQNLALNELQYQYNRQSNAQNSNLNSGLIDNLQYKHQNNSSIAESKIKQYYNQNIEQQQCETSNNNYDQDDQNQKQDTLIGKKRPRMGKTPASKIIWTTEEDEELIRLVEIYGDQSWHRLCKFMPNKTEIRCFKRWIFLKGSDKQVSFNYQQKQEEITKQISSCTQWTKEEDQILKEKVEQYGTQNWVIIARFLPDRLGRQCRERWHNVIDPNIVRREWTKQEDDFILKMHKQIGSRWSQISKMELLLGRTVSQIKNRFYQNLKGKDTSMIKYKSESNQQLSCIQEESNLMPEDFQQSKSNSQIWDQYHIKEDLQSYKQQSRKSRKYNQDTQIKFESCLSNNKIIMENEIEGNEQIKRQQQYSKTEMKNQGTQPFASQIEIFDEPVNQSRMKKRLIKSNMKNLKENQQNIEGNWLATCNISTKDNSPFIMCKSSDQQQIFYKTYSGLHQDSCEQSNSFQNQLAQKNILNSQIYSQKKFNIENRLSQVSEVVEEDDNEGHLVFVQKMCDVNVDQIDQKLKYNQRPSADQLFEQLNVNQFENSRNQNINQHMKIDSASDKKLSQSILLENFYPQSSYIINTLNSKSCFKSFSNSEAKSQNLKKLEKYNGSSSLRNSKKEYEKNKAGALKRQSAGCNRINGDNRHYANNIPRANQSDQKSLIKKVDMQSIQVRKFNLEIYEQENLNPITNINIGSDQKNGQKSTQKLNEISVVKKFCLPVFTQDIIDSFICLDINSSASKSHNVNCKNMYDYMRKYQDGSDEGKKYKMKEKKQNNLMDQEMNYACEVENYSMNDEHQSHSKQIFNINFSNKKDQSKKYGSNNFNKQMNGIFSKRPPLAPSFQDKKHLRNISSNNRKSANKQSDYAQLEKGEKSNSYTKIAQRSYMQYIDNSMSKESNNFSNHAEILLQGLLN